MSHPTVDGSLIRKIIVIKEIIEEIPQYKVNKIEVLGDIFEVNETVTSDDLLNKLKNDFPFKIRNDRKIIPCIYNMFRNIIRLHHQIFIEF